MKREPVEQIEQPAEEPTHPSSTEVGEERIVLIPTPSVASKRPASVEPIVTQPKLIPQGRGPEPMVEMKCNWPGTSQVHGKVTGALYTFKSGRPILVHAVDGPGLEAHEKSGLNVPLFEYV